VKLKKYESPDSDQILAELIQQGGKTLVPAIHKLINCTWNKEEIPDQWKESIIEEWCLLGCYPMWLL
jgi:hypothetical protein